jgi:hypothetical protein
VILKLSIYELFLYFLNLSINHPAYLLVNLQQSLLGNQLACLPQQLSACFLRRHNAELLIGQSLYLSTYLLIGLLVYLLMYSICVCPPSYVANHLSVYLLICLLVCLHTRPSLRLPANLPVSNYYLSPCLPVSHLFRLPT